MLVENMKTNKTCKCGHVQELSVGNILKRQVYYYVGAEKRAITLMYACCDKCKSIIPLQADNGKTLSILDKAQDAFLSDNKNQSRKYSIYKDDLKRARAKLVRKINGKKIYDENENLLINSLKL